VGNCRAAYQAASPDLRRDWNQTLFTKLHVDHQRITGGELAPLFAALLAHDLTQRFQRQAPLEEPDETDITRQSLFAGQGLSKTPWVELRGVEPLASSMRPRRSAS
jgi:hypothetical protein